MERNILKLIQSSLLVIFIYLVSCATITVNVYFPAEEVREAYSSLEDEFLEQDAQGTTDSEKAPQPTPSPSPGPQGKADYPDKPILTKTETKVIILKRELSLDFSNYAWAQGNISEQITQKIRSMPDVIAAYKRRAQRASEINQMLSKGLVAEGSQGLLVKKGTLSAQQTQAFNAENSDRKIIIRGMARAIVEINDIEPTKENIDKVLPEAARQFASVRRSER
jgi:cytoskeletal protein RodZ